MKHLWFGSILSAAIILAPLVKADDWDRRTFVTFNQPVEIPGAVLGAGTYVMKLLDLPGERDIVQFFNKDQTHLFKTVFAIPKYRVVATDDTLITFEERGAGAPQAIKSWYYPGELRGEEFMYSKVRPVMLTAQTSTASPNPRQVAAAPAPAPQPAPVQAQPAPVPIPAPVPATPQPVETAQVTPPPPTPATPAATQPEPKELPKTASELPLIALLGTLSVAAGLCLRRS